MAKIFLSHSSKDKKLVMTFCEFLRSGLDLTRKDIFCTALEES